MLQISMFAIWMILILAGAIDAKPIGKFYSFFLQLQEFASD
jgi:hypothetical protein